MTVTFISNITIGILQILSREMICHFGSVGFKFPLHDDVFSDGGTDVA